MVILVIMYVLLLPGVFLFIYLKHHNGGDLPKTVAVKAACTTLIVLASVIGTANYWQGASNLVPLLITAGLVFGLVGDVVICQSARGGFFSGMVYFAIGHVCYIAAFVSLSKHLLWSIPVFIVIYLLFLFFFRKSNMHPGLLLVPMLIYAAIITAMVSLSVTMPFSAKNGLILLVGAILFAISDAILAINSFSKSNGQKSDSFGLCCYFLGQSFFALSIYLILV